MIALLRFFVRLARLQQGPQDLPGSALLLVLCLTANVLVGMIGGSRYFGGAGLALLANLIDVTVVASMVWLLLSVNARQPRLLQTLTALFGLGALFGLAMAVLEGLTTGLGDSALRGLLMLALLIWVHVAMGHVLRHALDQSLVAGTALAVGISAVSFVVVGNLLPVPAPPAG